jgi:hypothetical protein
MRKDPNPDPFSISQSEQESGVRHPRRWEAEKNVPSSTTPMRRARCYAYRDSGKIIANATPTILDLNITYFDSVGLHDQIINNSRITLPTTGRVSGLWILLGHVLWDAAAAAQLTLKIFATAPGGAATAIVTSQDASSAAASVSQEALAFVDDPIPGTYYYLEVTQATGAPLTLFGGLTQMYFEAIHLW